MITYQGDVTLKAVQCFDADDLMTDWQRGLSCHSSGLVSRKLSSISTMTENIRNAGSRGRPPRPAAISVGIVINDGSLANALNMKFFLL